VNSQNDTGNGECLTEDLISGYLEGVLTPVVKSACEVHLVACDRCRENLATLMRLLRTDVDPEEEAELNRAMAQWDRRELQPNPTRRGPSIWKRISYGLGAIAAVFVVVLIVRAVLSSGQPSAEDLVQALLENKRPFDAQLSHQPYMALSNTRGPEVGAPSSLLNEMTKRSADAYRFGRFYLVLGEHDKAIEYLQTAAKDPKAPPEVHNDLGVGYLQRYQDGDFERSLRELGDALDQNPDFLPAIFNLSLLYERKGLTADAERQWTRYLTLDSTSGWADEIRQKLSRKDFEK
jgi:tetratricopeptide (TPR) repeat protein